MFIKKSIIRLFSILLVVLLMSVTASARPLDAPPPLGTGFTYQGKLTNGGVTANGTYDFEFKLYDALSGGSPVGGTVTQGDVTVTAGLFTVLLDFGNVFDGTALYLEIGVRPVANGGIYTTLTPRQQLSATPYAVYASNAPWSGLIDVPAGFADGVDNGSAYQNVKVVAKSGGDFTTITAALNSIMDASTSNRYLVWVAPGVYNERVTMKQYVDIEGAGELTTRITFTGSATGTSATLVGANETELRFLTVENTGGNYVAYAIINSSASPRLTHVTASASGGTEASFGVYNYSSSPTMTDVTASASGGTNSIGVYNSSSSSPTMTNVTARASGGTFNYGVCNDSSSPAMTNVTTSASGGTYSYGVYNSSSSPTMMNVSAIASGGTNSIGLYNFASSATINNCVISGSNYGIDNFASSSSYTVRVNNSQISGGTNTIRNDAEFTTRVGASQLSGGAVIGGGTVSCAGVYDENYVFSASTCP
jgi:pectin methylesterase-like acyl-CoA thioesterase